MKEPKSAICLSLMIAVYAFCILVARGQTLDPDAAEGQYYFANTLYFNASCMEAYEADNRAFELYTKAGDEEGVLKTRSLLGNISMCLKAQADKKYAMATILINNKSYNRSISLCAEANMAYEAIKDNKGLEGCGLVIERARQKLMAETAGGGEDAFKDAYDLYALEDYLNARDKAAIALDLYISANHSEGTEKSRSLLNVIEKRITTIQINGWDALNDSVEAYGNAKKTQRFEDYYRARTSASNAKVLFEQIGDNSGYDGAQDIIKNCDYEMPLLESRYEVSAGTDLERCRMQLLYSEAAADETAKKALLENASILCQASMDGYAVLASRAGESGNASKLEEFKDAMNDAGSKANETRQKLRECCGGIVSNGSGQNASKAKTEGLSSQTGARPSSGTPSYPLILPGLLITGFIVLILYLGKSNKK